MKHRESTSILASACAVAACCVVGACGTSPGDGLPDEIGYNWDVRPILSEHCFKCHGPDPEAREASLRLDVGELAVQRLEGPRPRFAIVPGDPEASELIRRIDHADADERMPPQSERKALGERDKAILRRWIAEGADYQPHWAFIPPERPEPPNTNFGDRAANAVDRFVLRRLEEADLAPSPEADRETLINRLSLTLTGLPPTLDEVDAFVADEAPDAYARVVDRLLASPRYAEHMAAFWMDFARYSESDGFLDDHHDRTFWPYRDWVIAAFDRNMPFDEFATWQLAGDLLPNATREQVLATAYVRLGKRTTENGAIDEEYKAEYMIERTDNALGVTFLGLTVGCARCHDHKYDPISQRDYYALGAFFNSTDEIGVYAPGFSGIQGGPTLPWPDAETQAKIDAAAATVAEREAAYRAAIEHAAETVAPDVTRLTDGSPARVAATLDASLAAVLAAHYPFETTAAAALEDLPVPRAERTPPPTLTELERNPFAPPPPTVDETPEERERRAAAALAQRVPRNYVAAEMTLSPAATPGVPPAVIQAPMLRDGVSGRALFFDATNRGFLGRDVGWYDRSDPFSLDFWFFAADEYDDVPIVNHLAEQNSGRTGYRLAIERGRLWVSLAHAPPANMIALESMAPFPIGEWTHVTLTYDGSSRAAGTRVYLNGAPAAMRVDHDSLTRSILPWTSADVFDPFLGLAFGTRFREKAPVGSGLDELRVFDRDLTPLEVAFLHERTAALHESVRTRESPARESLTALLVANDSGVVAAREALTAARRAHDALVTAVPQVLVMGDAPEPIPTFVLGRGVYSAPGERVSPRGLDSVFPWDESLPENRLGLARWLFDPRNPLTARVFVNRIWQMHFGRGIVETAEDFGAQGAIPSHPDLLDWLAVELVESGWDVKALHRLIVTSATYRQSSGQSSGRSSSRSSAASDEPIARDARNALLARGPRFRMSAEMIRDHALAVSGLLTGEIGGPSVTPYQPERIWNPLNSFYAYPGAEALPAEAHHRRTLYSFVKRNALHPTLDVFDFKPRTESIARRRSSSTPLQALVLLNDPQYLEAYRELAARVLRFSSDRRERLTRLYRIVTRRTPGAAHLDVLRRFYEERLAVVEGDPNKAARLLDVGVTEPDAAIDANELAAMMQVAALVMSSPDAYTVR